MMTCLKSTCVIILFIGSLLGNLMTPSLAGAEIYRWSDQNGKIHYATNPPSDASGPVEVKRNNRWYPYAPGENGANASTPSSPTVTYTTSNPGADWTPPTPLANTMSGEIVLP